MLYNIESVPTFVILNKGTVQDTLVGANPPELTKRVAAVSQSLPAASVATPQSTEDALSARLKTLINSSQVIVFIKGTVDEPRCGFSNKILTLLKATGVSFSTFDILSDNAIREGLKLLSKWPTYPQLYVKGQLVGGLDIVKELQEEGSLIDTLNGA
jgi:Grx4 family monothiol glutaredoxin